MGPLSQPFNFFSKNPFSQIYISILILLFIVVTGVSGYMLIEGFRFIDALYMTIITVSTVGFSEVQTLSTGGRAFTIGLIIFSFGTFAYAISALTTHLISGEFQRYFKDYQVNKSIHRLENHVIICGYGRNGSRAAEELAEHHKPFVIVEQNPNIIEKLRVSKEFLFVEGNAMIDETLIHADIHKASALITALPEDSDNLYIVLTARSLNKDLFIISRASTDGADSKLRMAGANNVIMPDRIGGAYMASLVVHPDVMEFMDNIISQSSDPSNIEEIDCDKLHDTLQSSTVGELRSKMKGGATIIGFKTSDNKYVINPENKVSLDSGTKLFILGTKDQLKEFYL